MQITVLVENGGDNITEFVKRNMRFMLGDDLARKFNLTGQKGKRSFAKLVLFDILFSKFLV